MKNQNLSQQNLVALANQFEASELEERLEYGWGSSCTETICYQNTCTGDSMTITMPCE